MLQEGHCLDARSVACGDKVEVACSECRRRYAVADHKVIGRRRQSRCRCGSILIFDGRLLGPPDARPDEDPLPRAAAHGGGLDEAPPPARAADAPPRAEGRDPRVIARIQLRSSAKNRSLEAPSPRASRDVAAASLQTPRPKVTEAAPGSSSEAPESPRDLKEAFDTLELDKLADRYRPAWDDDTSAPSSRRVTAPGDDPEVVVHFPPKWQPPPSQQRRLRANWESPPAPTARPGAEAEDAPLDDPGVPGGPALADAETSSERAEPAPTSARSPDLIDVDAFIERAAATLGPQPSPAASPSPDADDTVADDTPAEATPGRAAPGVAPFDSTAPSAYSQRPAARRASRSGQWAAMGLAALALIGIAWRLTQPTASDAVGARQPAGPEPKTLADAPPAPAEPRRSTLPGPSPATTASELPRSAAESGPASNAAPQDTPASPPSGRPVGSDPARGQHAPERVSAPGPVRPSAPTRQASSDPSPRAPSSPVSESPPTDDRGPDPSQIAAALATAAGNARSCKAEGGPSGSGSVRVLLNPVGGVLNATALGGYQGTNVGRCVESTFRRARTQPFSGRSLSTVYGFSIPED